MTGTALLIATVSPRCFPLRLILGGTICFLLMALGSIVIFFSYNSQKQAALVSAGKIFERSSLQTEEKLRSTISAVESFVAVSATLHDLGVPGQEGMRALLPYFRQSFASIPWMVSVFVGFNDGNFYMIRALRDNQQARASVSAPEQAEYVVKTIVHGEKAAVTQRYIFYDSSLQIVAERPAEYDGYDPRDRSWYKEAQEGKQLVVTQPYVFFTTRHVGISVARSLAEGNGIVGADVTLMALSGVLQEQKLTPGTEIAILNSRGKVVISSDKDVLRRQYAKVDENERVELDVGESGVEVLEDLFAASRTREGDGYEVLELEKGQWFGYAHHLLRDRSQGLTLLTAAPMDELMAEARATRGKNILILAMVMVVAIGAGLIVARRIASPLQKLSQQAEGIRDFRLNAPLTVSSSVREVHDLAADMTIMQSAITHFLEIAHALSAEKKMERVLEMIVAEARAVTVADGGGIGLVSDDGHSFFPVMICNDRTGVHQGGMSDEKIAVASLMLAGNEASQAIEARVISSAQTFATADRSEHGELDFTRLVDLHSGKGVERSGQGESDCRSFLLVPLLNRNGEVIGVLHLVNARHPENDEVIAFGAHKISYVQALASNAALALDNNRLLRAQKELFDSFVKLLAGAIDTKSPYTGGHCQRVPVIAGMLADAAVRDETAPFADFSLSEDERYALYVASWLHDCGKVTTPEYVVDKATKLETIYNRIHEIRTRFEVLWRDAELKYRDALAERPEERELLHEQLVLRRQQLQDDFAFVASCNRGGEFMDPERVERLKQIGAQSWVRNFDNRLGLSGDEEHRLSTEEDAGLPVLEKLLLDRHEHVIARGEGWDDSRPYGDNPWKFNMIPPHDAYNHGELYNLTIARGTLTAEERYKINDHIVQTIIMLNKLPFPKELKRVPSWAGNHHETLKGSGYPRGLGASDLSVPERIMAIADIFEALTATDRPYNRPKSLSTCLQIMAHMRDQGHICPDLFALLLRSGVYRDYAARYMRPEQVDDVDIARFLPA